MSKNLKKILLISLVLNLVHMIEVILSGYYLFGFESFSSSFQNMSSAIYFSSHIFLYLGISVFVLSHLNKNFFKYSLIAYSWVFISESHHIVRSAISLEYFPGSLTSLLYVVLGYFYITQLFKDLKSKKLFI